MSKNSKQVEIGEAVTLDTETKSYLVHVRGNPAKEAKAIKTLLEKGWTQAAIGKEMHLTQGAISKRLSLFSLIPALFKMFEEGKLRPSAGYLLAKLPTEEQQKFAKQKERITVKAAEQARRKESVSEKLVEALGSDEIGFGGSEPYFIVGSKNTGKGSLLPLPEPLTEDLASRLREIRSMIEDDERNGNVLTKIDDILNNVRHFTGGR